ncbi:MAG: hypothetical protein ABR553_03450, partial [Gammaproteobacteria bacterium]
MKTLLGHSFSASGMASLIAASLAVAHARLPARAAAAGWPTRADGTRVAAISGLGADGCCAHLILGSLPTSIPADLAAPAAGVRQLIKTIRLGGPAIQDGIAAQAQAPVMQKLRDRLRVLGASPQPAATTASVHTLTPTPRPKPGPASHDRPAQETRTMANHRLTHATPSRPAFDAHPETGLDSDPLQHYHQNLQALNRLHGRYLDDRYQAAQQIGELIALQLAFAGTESAPGLTTLAAPTAPAAVQSLPAVHA